MKQIIILLFCLFSLFTNSVYAQPLLTLEEAVATVLKNNYDIQLRKNDSAVFALNNSYANAAFLPDFNAATTMLLNNNNTKQTLADGTQKNQSGIRSNNIQASVNMNWTIFDGFKMFATKKAPLCAEWRRMSRFQYKMFWFINQALFFLRIPAP